MNTIEHLTTFAIITDFHGNDLALTKALSLIDEHPHVDKIISLGDCFSLGAAPEESLQILKAMQNVIFLRGNHDRYIVERIWEYDRPTVEGMDPDDPVCIDIIANEQWTAEKIGEPGVQFIRKMKLSHYVNVQGTYVEFTHAWFGRDEMPPSLDEAKVWRDHEQVKHADAKRFVLVHGHTHVPREEHFGNLSILCPGSTGLPFDSDQRGVVAFHTVGDDVCDWQVVRFDYDVDAAIEKMKTAQPPFYQNLTNTLRYAGIRNDLSD